LGRCFGGRDRIGRRVGNRYHQRRHLVGVWNLRRRAIRPRSYVASAHQIVAAVRIPVTADIESGYGATPDDLAITVSALIGIGVAGINIEDRTRRPWPPTSRPARKRA
jgi:hypothetical protein